MAAPLGGGRARRQRQVERGDEQPVRVVAGGGDGRAVRRDDGGVAVPRPAAPVCVVLEKTTYAPVRRNPKKISGPSDVMEILEIAW